MRGVIGGGNFIVDYVKTIDHYPVEQTLADIRGEYMGSGGAPYNVLRCLAKLGGAGPLAAVGRIGDDAAGAYILDDCRNHDIDVSRLIVTPGVPTSYTVVMVVSGSGRRTFFHQRGANAHLEPGDFDFDGFAGWHLHYGYLLLLDGMDKPDAEFGTAAARVLARAKAAGLTTSIDLVSEDSDRFRTVVPPALKYADLVFMNEFEAVRTTGVQLDGPVRRDWVREVHQAIAAPGTLVLHWPEGATACGPSGEITWQGGVQMPGDRTASVTGSGDAFAAGYLLCYMRGDTLEDCLRLAVCSAASSVTGFTCTDGVGSELECLTLAEAYGYRASP